MQANIFKNNNSPKWLCLNNHLPWLCIEAEVAGFWCEKKRILCDVDQNDVVV